MPDILDILLDGSVGGELADESDVADGHLCPALLILVGFADIMLRLDVRPEIRKDEIAVGGIHALPLEKAVVQRTEKLGILRGIGAVYKLDQNLADLLIFVEDAHGIVAAVLLVVHDLLGGKTEDEGVLFAHFLDDLDVGAVHGAESDRTVEHELHVACSGSFLTGRGDLLGNIRCRDDDLSVGDLVVFDEDDLDLVVDGLVVVDDIRDGIDQLDRQLGGLVAGRSLCAENKGVLGDIQRGILLDLVVQIHDMKDVQQLPFILVQTFYLNVEDGSGIDLDAVVLKDVIRQTDLVFILDIQEFLPGSLVIRIYPEFLHSGEVCDPLVSDVIGDPVRQQGVAVQQETPLGDAVGLVVELLGEHLVEVLELTVLEDLCVEPGNAVDAVTGDDRHIGHTDLTVIDDAHAALFLFDVGAGILVNSGDLRLEPVMDLLHDLVNAGKEL